MRADILLVARGLAPSRTTAQRLIAAGRVRWPGDTVISKSGSELPDDAQPEVTPASDDADRYVSRGGLKLAGAMARTQFKADGCLCLDLGLSTGGFADCLLQAGAAGVVGIEVGHGQLHPRLAADQRVVQFEGINARTLTPAMLGPSFPADGFDVIVADLSFISLTLVLPVVPPLLKMGGTLLALVKPQFEVGRAGVGKGGIVREVALYPEVEARIRKSCAASGLAVAGYFDSPITGGDGNREFFVYAVKSSNPGT